MKLKPILQLDIYLFFQEFLILQTYTINFSSEFKLINWLVC